MRGAQFTVAAAAGLLFCSAALATPIVDGRITASDGYALVLLDTPGETGYVPHMNIKAVRFDSDASFYYIGLELEDPPLDPNGSNTAARRRTWFSLNFYNNGSDPSPYRILDVYTTSYTKWTASLYDENGDGIWGDKDPNSSVAIGTDPNNGGLELRIPIAHFSGLATTPYVRGQLDNQGAEDDDQIEGYVPEPLSLTALAVGAAPMLLRRRR
jgi:hypothetical protein